MKKYSIWLLGFAALVAGACSTDRTGDETLALSASSVSANKRGMTYEGGDVTFDVLSNVYWVINLDEDADWLTVAPRAAYGNQTVKVTAAVNPGGRRSTTLRFDSLDGVTAQIEVTQGSSDELIYYIRTGAGASAVAEPVAVGGYTAWEPEGVGASAVGFSGVNAFVSADTPSSGYDEASGGNNIVLEVPGEGPETVTPSFSVRDVATRDDSYFRLKMGVLAPGGELTPDRDYAVAVQALYESKPEYNSEFTADIAVHTPALLTRPVVHLYDGFEVTHNMAIVEWDIDAAQQSDTKTSLQLLEGSKLIYNFSKWGLPSAKYKFPRFVFGGLKANTTYTARIQRISADASKFGDSEWGEYTFTTTAKADHSDCLFYADFNEHWWGGNGAAIAFGMYPKTEKDDLTGDLTQLAYTSGTPVKNMPNPNSGCGAVPADYHRLFLSQWDASKLPTATEDYMLRSYLTAGILKFGSTENNGYMPIPYMTSLTGPTTVVLTFKSSPYCEPNTSTGDLEVGNAVLDGREGVWVRLKEADGAKIVKADGVAVAAENATDVLVKHKLPAEYGANSKKCFEFTDHEVVIEGVTAKTLIQIYTKLYKATAEYDKYNTPGDRAWIDDVIVRKQ